MPLSDRIRRLAEKFSEPPRQSSAGAPQYSAPSSREPPQLPPRPSINSNSSRIQENEAEHASLEWSSEDPCAVLGGSGARALPNTYKVRRDIVDSRLLAHAVPTNAWWQNLIIEGGDQPVLVAPYMVKCLGETVVVCAPTPLEEDRFVASVWHNDWTIRVPGCARHRVAAFDALSVTVDYVETSAAADGSDRAAAVASLPLVKGSAFATVVFNRPTVLGLESVHAVLKVDCAAYGPGAAVVELNNGATWLVCYEGNAVLRHLDGSRIESSEAVQGSVRLALIPGSDSSSSGSRHDAITALLSARKAVPVGGSVDVQATDSEAVFEITWSTAGQGGDPAMCTLPHHRQTMADGCVEPMDAVAPFWSSKGPMHVVRGRVWRLTEQLEPLGFSGPVPLTDAAHIRRLCELVAADAASLPADASALPPDPYFFGKALARAARIALIAEEVGDHASSQHAADLAVAWFEPWILGTNGNALVYDTEWRGMVSRAGLHDPGADFGQGRYNDHHFHYGYFVYAAAVLARLRPGWLDERRRAFVDLLVRDFCTPLGARAPSAAAGAASLVPPHYFPQMRCFDMYDGHSWAAGLFAFADSRNQESTSEAINAYYGAYLYAQTTGRPHLARYVRAVLQLEARGTRTYWHLGDLASGLYPESYAHDKAIVGILWSTKVDYATFFGANPEFIYGIQFLPLTPASALILKRSWLADIWPRYLDSVSRNSASPQWREIIDLALAVVDKQAAFERIAGTSAHDDGNSASNSYYWVATAPEA
ncbi:hypothetical protein H4217_003999 [Coemansia sp. RSA 1939]|nr:hypothetical protein H4217_003999 [Coemansia sp. RSA 1939]KAJ2612529.1 hypothetical protein EV177_002952 [Coemansia sp. RSA 1804]